MTESVFLDPTTTMQSTLRRLRTLGVGLSLDDFGVGYSSLSYLRRGAFNKIKVDSAFVRDLPTERGDVAIVRAVVDIASALGMTVTAEGVEFRNSARSSVNSAVINSKAICLASPFRPRER